jgi:hypothetical protein
MTATGQAAAQNGGFLLGADGDTGPDQELSNGAPPPGRDRTRGKRSQTDRTADSWRHPSVDHPMRPSTQPGRSLQQSDSVFLPSSLLQNSPTSGARQGGSGLPHRRRQPGTQGGSVLFPRRRSQQQELSGSCPVPAGVPHSHAPSSSWSAGRMLAASGASALTVYTSHGAEPGPCTHTLSWSA